MKTRIDDLPPASELDIIPFPRSKRGRGEASFERLWATDVMKDAGVETHLQAAVLADPEATHMICAGI